MLFTDLLKDDLVKAVKFYKVDVDVNANKQALANALLDAGITPEQWDKESYEWENGAKPEEDSGAITTDVLDTDDDHETSTINDGDDYVEGSLVDETVPAVEPEETFPEDALVLVRFVGKNKSYRTGKHVFSANRPFALMEPDEFERLDPKKFREATKSEALEYYN